MDFIIYQTDESFEYCDDPFYYSSCPMWENHGFRIEFDKEDIPIVQTLEGFGEFEEEIKERGCKSYLDLWVYLGDLISRIEKGEFDDFDGEEDPKGLISALREIKDRCLIFMGHKRKAA